MGWVLCPIAAYYPDELRVLMSEDAFETLLTFRVCNSMDSILSEKTEKIVLDSRDFDTRAGSLPTLGSQELTISQFLTKES